jgi:hypothetical protein
MKKKIQRESTVNASRRPCFALGSKSYRQKCCRCGRSDSARRARCSLSYDSGRRVLQSGVIGQTITLNQVPMTVIGVLRPNFNLSETPTFPMLPAVRDPPAVRLNWPDLKS